jgi:hypothetical protein
VIDYIPHIHLDAKLLTENARLGENMDNPEGSACEPVVINIHIYFRKVIQNEIIISELN